MTGVQTCALPISASLSAAVLLGASAASFAAENPFASQALSAGYQVAEKAGKASVAVRQKPKANAAVSQKPKANAAVSPKLKASAAVNQKLKASVAATKQRRKVSAAKVSVALLNN